MPPIQLLPLSSGPTQPLQEFRVRAPALATLILAIVIALLVWVGLRGGVRVGGGALPAFIAWWTAFWLGLLWLFYFAMVRKARHPDAWLVRTTMDGLYIKWRSYLNVGWGRTGPQVIFVPYEQIVSARQHKRHWLSPENQSGGVRHEQHTFLELQLDTVDLAPLEHQLANERAGKPDGKTVQTTRWGHFPVSVEPGNVLRIEWRARPGVGTLLEQLNARGIPLGAAADSEADLHATASEADVAELARRGDLMTLIRVLRVREALTLADARDKAKALIAATGNDRDRH